MVSSYQQDIVIDPDDLATEWVQQPTKYVHYTEQKAAADKRKSEIRQELDVLKAKTARIIRDSADKKPTEKAIEAAVIENGEVQRKESELIQATYEANVLSGAVEAFQHRKKALEKLADMAIFGITADPKGGRVDKIREMKQRNRQTKQEELLEESGEE